MTTPPLLDLSMLEEALEDPLLEKDFEEVFSFVETITDHKFKPSYLTEEDIERWNKRFDTVLNQIFKCAD